VVYPTTAVRHRALACDATDNVAIQKIIDMKGKIFDMEHLVFVQDEAMLEQYIGILPSFVKDYLHRQEDYVTIIYPHPDRIAHGALNPDGSIAVRIVPSIDTLPIQMSRNVLRLLGKPIFVTSCKMTDNGERPMTYQDLDPRIISGVNSISPITFGVDDTNRLSIMITYNDGGQITVLRRP